MKTPQERVEEIWRIGNNLTKGETERKNEIAQSITHDRIDLLDEVGKIIDRLTVYYRSKFSLDCSRNETEEEKNTEMIELQQVLEIVATLTQQLSEQSKRE